MIHVLPPRTSWATVCPRSGSSAHGLSRTNEPDRQPAPARQCAFIQTMRLPINAGDNLVVIFGADIPQQQRPPARRAVGRGNQMAGKPVIRRHMLFQPQKVQRRPRRAVHSERECRQRADVYRRLRDLRVLKRHAFLDPAQCLHPRPQVRSQKPRLPGRPVPAYSLPRLVRQALRVRVRQRSPMRSPVGRGQGIRKARPHLEGVLFAFGVCPCGSQSPFSSNFSPVLKSNIPSLNTLSSGTSSPPTRRVQWNRRPNQRREVAAASPRLVQPERIPPVHLVAKTGIHQLFQTFPAPE